MDNQERFAVNCDRISQQTYATREEAEARAAELREEYPDYVVKVLDLDAESNEGDSP